MSFKRKKKEKVSPKKSVLEIQKDGSLLNYRERGRMVSHKKKAIEYAKVWLSKNEIKHGLDEISICKACLIFLGYKLVSTWKEDYLYHLLVGWYLKQTQKEKESTNKDGEVTHSTAASAIGAVAAFMGANNQPLKGVKFSDRVHICCSLLGIDKPYFKLKSDCVAFAIELHKKGLLATSVKKKRANIEKLSKGKVGIAKKENLVVRNDFSYKNKMGETLTFDHNDLCLTLQWHGLRRQVLRLYGNKCMKCSKTDSEMHVDHIKPKSKYPLLALDINNLQVLCKECNIQKSNIDSTDYRTNVHMTILYNHLIK